MKQKEKIKIHSIMREFDEYVSNQLQNKPLKKAFSQPENQVDAYYHSMQKRLKLKPVTQDQKFQKLLGPMKSLKSFVSIKEFLRRLNLKPSKQPVQNKEISQITKQKLQYEDLRGGLYMQRVQNHLKRKNMTRRLDNEAELFLQELQEHEVQNNDYRQWMQSTLGKISMKEESFLRVGDYTQNQQQLKNKSSDNQMIFVDLTNNQNINLNSNRKQNHLVRVSEQQEEKNFKKVSDFLTERLKKILTDKYVNNSSKKCNNNKKNFSAIANYEPNKENFQQFSPKIATQPTMMTTSQTYQKGIIKESFMTKRGRESIKLPVSRMYTSQSKAYRRSENTQTEAWKQKMNVKMNGLMVVTEKYYKKCQEEKKEYKKIVNPFTALDKDQG